MYRSNPIPHYVMVAFLQALLVVPVSAVAATLTIYGPGAIPEPAETAAVDGYVADSLDSSPAAARYLLEAQQFLAQGNLFFAIRSLEQARSLTPEMTSVQMALGYLYNRIGRYQDAIAAANAALALTTNGIDPHIVLGTANQKLNRPREAIRHFEKLLKDPASRATGFFNVGNTYFVNEDWAPALENFELALHEQPDMEAALLKRVIVLEEMGQHRDAIGRALEYIAAHPDNPVIRVTLGSAHESLGQVSEADKNYRAAVRLSQGTTYFQRRQAEYFTRQGKLDQAIATYRDIVTRYPNEPNAHRRLATLYIEAGMDGQAAYENGFIAWREGRFDDAVRYYKSAIKLKPDLLDAYLDLSELLLQSGDTAGARKYAGLVLEQDDTVVMAYSLLGQISRADGELIDSERRFLEIIESKPEYFPAYTHLGDLYKATGRCRDAIPLFNRAVDLAPDAGKPHRELGDCYLSAGLPTVAIEQYELAIGISPVDADAMNSLAWLYMETGQKESEALFLAENAALLDPENPAIADTLGWLYFLDGRPELALENVKIASRRLPDQPTVLYHLGAIHFDLGNRQESLTALRQALDLGIPFPEAELAEALIQTIKSLQNGA